MKHFSFKEMIKSDTAKKLGVDNTPNWDLIECLLKLIQAILDPLRELWGKPIQVTSGFRSKALNSLVGGVINSHHTGGYAADITVGSILKNKQLFDMLITSNLEWTQAILEEGGTWIHISYIEDNLKKQILYT